MMKPKRRYAKKAKAPTFEKRVMNVIQKTSEKKLSVISVANNTNIAGGGLSSTTAAGLLFSNILSSFAIAQGTEQQQRIGNKIQNCKLQLRGFVEGLTYNAVSNQNPIPFELHMVIYKSKDDPLGNPSNLIQAPSGITIQPDSSVMSSLYPWNRDKYIIKKHKVFRLSGPPVASGTQEYLNPSYNSNKDTWFRRFVVDVPISKTLKFNDGVSTPSNDWFSVGFYLISGDGATLSLTQIKAQVSMDATLTFDDY